MMSTSTIVCPTDFSETAENAIEYASAFARYLDARIVLVHVMHIPAVDVFSPSNMMKDMMDDLQKDTDRKLDSLCAELNSKHGLSFEYRSKFGFAAEVICELAEEQEARIVCMGTMGKSNVLDRFLGSISYETVKKSKIPVLVVPRACKFQEITRIAVGNDNKESLENDVEELFELFKSFNPQIEIINVDTSAGSDYKWELKWEEKNIKIIEIEAQFADKAISRYVDENQTRLLALKRHHRSFIENLFHKSTIKRVLGESHIPALVFN